MSEEIIIINRKNEQVPLDFNKILTRISTLINKKPALNIKADYIAQQTISRLTSLITTKELDNVSSTLAANMITVNPDYGILASRLIISNLHKQTHSDYKKVVENIVNYYDSNNNLISTLDKKFIKFVYNYGNELNLYFNYENDYNFTYFGLMTLKKSYLFSHFINDEKIILERPQHMYMRVAIGIHLDNINDDGYFHYNSTYNFNDIINTYNLLSNHKYTHATPTLFNAGTHRQSLSSCFLLEVNDSLEDIYKTLTDTARISKWSGGIGIHVSQIRSKGALIKGTNGRSEGLVPMLKLFENSALYVSQGGGKRKGSTAVYIEPWHYDIESIIYSQRQTGDEKLLLRDLFISLYIPDLFMKRLKKSIITKKPVFWSLFCPGECPYLADKYGDEFEKLYIKYENEGKYKKQLNIKDFWFSILKVIIEKGNPYVGFKDNINRKCNQNNLGTIKSSNLCVHEDTLILTENGYEKIKDINNKTVNLWNGFEWSLSNVFKTGEQKKLIKIMTDDGCEINCTPYHKFSINDDNGNIVEIPADKLKIGNKISKCNYPIIEGNKINDLKNAYYQGMLCASRCDLNNSEYFKLFNYKSSIKYLKFMSPKTTSTKNCKLEWLAGIVDKIGCLSHVKDDITLSLYSSYKEFLMDIKLICNTIGLNPKVTKNYKIEFNNNETYKLFKELILPVKVLKYNFNYKSCKTDFIKIESIKNVDGLYDTYCFNEPKLHQGIFNGILTKNCHEINIYTDKDRIGVCNLASISLTSFVKNLEFDYNDLYNVAYSVTINLNKVIDNNVYPVKEGQFADKENRPIGIGVQGLADVFMKMKLPFTSKESKRINKNIFETIYYASLSASCFLSKKYGPYGTFYSSMTGKNLLQFDLCNVTPDSGLWNWDELRKTIKAYGLYNSLLVALMPTASTAQILGNTESFEPITSNMYNRSVLSGSFQVVNKYLINDLMELGIWNNSLKEQIIKNDGSVQGIDIIPSNIQEIYKTVWELSLKDLVEMDVDRSAYVCQSMSANRYLDNPNNNKLTNMYIYAWENGLKTGSYYLRTKTHATALKFNIKPTKKVIVKEEKEEEECLVCSA